MIGFWDGFMATLGWMAAWTVVLLAIPAVVGAAILFIKAVDGFWSFVILVQRRWR